MHIEKMQSLAESMVVNGVLTKSTTPISMSLNVMGYSSEEVFKRSCSLPVIDTYTPIEDDPVLSDFCMELNKGLAQREASKELLISTPYHLFKHGEVKGLIDIARRYKKATSSLAFMTRKEIYETICTKDTNIARSVSRMVNSNKLIELKVGSVTDPLYPTFQLDENIAIHPTIPVIMEALQKNNMSVLDFCLWVADENGFVSLVKKVSRKYYKAPFKVLSNHEDTLKLLELLFEDDLDEL